MNAEDRCFCELAPLYALGLLDESQRRWVEEQVAASPDLAVELAELEASVAALSYGVDEISIAPDLKHRLFEQLEQVDPPPSNVLPFDRALRADTPRSADHSRRNLWLQVGGTLAAMTTIALLADNLRLRREVQDTQALVTALENPSIVAYALQGTENATSASGSLVVNSSQDAIVVLVQNLPELPVGQAYRLWAMPDANSKPLYCGQFTSRSTGSTVRLSPPDAGCRGAVAQMLITTESSTAPPVPAGQLVMQGAVVN
ncbi:MAG: anti-sigma factor [Leptolyngbyaceae cyanobacterium CSU_1_3]|nr:anti-sigma factor [Leptolyngbyaceae cyanobacterium CSU_1_3]